MWHDMTGYMSGAGWGHMLFGGVMMVLFWGLVIALIVMLVMRLTGHRARSHRTAPDALELLRQRYARGEIDRQEFEARKRDLSE
ncbi:SHOCT domain-containing protein [Modicisalibacter tunisiensis]|uniref:SHOCT domain-containing protein n=1 Tax=Modicisalibacter tunisiensis TaxID=390637 RepID=A0ABS7WY24_9GAMM|nr:SHOCT domain-containing protein [Modicisalibacter tunisiensis]MBZ9567113.1 SHOCT domain-containing protein [Modicisalibacter tunisiensis]